MQQTNATGHHFIIIIITEIFRVA